MSRILITLAFMIACATSAAAERMALVLGNGAYQYAKPLPNAANDARDMSHKLRGMGFNVYEGVDLPRRDMMQLVQAFAQQLKTGDTALFYYAGHGIQMGRNNFIMPVDAQEGDEDALRSTSVSLQSILASLESRAATRIVILDACRNNPFLKPRDAARSTVENRGFMRMEAGVGSFIAFSTEPGNVASDGNGRNSPFTAALLQHIDTPGADIHAVMRKVRSDVKRSSNDRQIPWENSSLIDEVYLAALPDRSTNTQQPLSKQITPSATFTPQVQQVPQPTFPTAQQVPQYSHRVQGLDPNGDGFLALRQGTYSGAPRLATMPEGTLLNVLQSDGVWLLVQTDFGMRGWAHSNWIAPNTAMAPVQNFAPAQNRQTLAGSTCDQLWHRRNTYFAQGGYCFSSARGRAAFGHLPCVPGRAAGAVNLTAAQRADIDAIRAQEAAMNCR